MTRACIGVRAPFRDKRNIEHMRLLLLLIARFDLVFFAARSGIFSQVIREHHAVVLSYF